MSNVINIASRWHRRAVHIAKLDCLTERNDISFTAPYGSGGIGLTISMYNRSVCYINTRLMYDEQKRLFSVVYNINEKLKKLEPTSGAPVFLRGDGSWAINNKALT